MRQKNEAEVVLSNLEKVLAQSQEARIDRARRFLNAAKQQQEHTDVPPHKGS